MGPGPHDAAYRGPTPDNPSLSLKTRLKRARFFDERDRKAGVQPASSSGSAEAMMAHARAARDAHDEEAPAFWPHDRRENVAVVRVVGQGVVDGIVEVLRIGG